MWTINEEHFEDFGTAGFLLAKKYMSQLHELLRSHNIDLTVVVYPWPDQIYYGDQHSPHVKFWRGWSNERNVPFVDLFPLFLEEPSRLKTIRKYYFLGDVHWTKVVIS